MYDIDLKQIKSQYTFSFLLPLFGLIMAAMMLAPSLTMQKVQNKIQDNKNKFDSQATATKIDYESYKNDKGRTMYTPIYYFEVDGQEYSCKSNVSSNNTENMGSKIVYYNKNNPSECMTGAETNFGKSTIYFSIFLCIIPLIIVVIGLIVTLKIRKKFKKREHLAKNGMLIKNLPYTIISDYVIAVEYTLPDGTIKRLTSNPKHASIKKSVDLLIDPDDSSNYYIDYNIEQKY